MAASRSHVVTKHSSNDLQSRLKTRKLLGVGETDDGDVHRSKLSQILGHSEQLHVKLPPGIRVWTGVLLAYYALTGLWAVLMPAHFSSSVLGGEGGSDVTYSCRLQGAALLGLAAVCWNCVSTQDKDTAANNLISSAAYFTIALFSSLLSGGASTSASKIFFAFRLMCLIGNIAFLYALTGGPRVTRRSNSSSIAEETPDFDTATGSEKKAQ